MIGPARPDLPHLIDILREDGFTLPATTARVGWFGDGPELARTLGDLVRKGVKTASAGLLWEWETQGASLPRIGDVEIIIDWNSRPLAVIEMTEVRVLSFEQVDAAFAHDEGEGDRSLATWREKHWRYFTQRCACLNHAPTPTMPVVCQRFRLLHAMAGDPKP
jgi:uncharacterized protein YhfF